MSDEKYLGGRERSSNKGWMVREKIVGMKPCETSWPDPQYWS